MPDALPLSVLPEGVTPEDLGRRLMTPLRELEISPRAFGALVKNDVTNVADILYIGPSDLLQIRHFGVSAYRETVAALRLLGFKWPDFSGDYRERLPEPDVDTQMVIRPYLTPSRRKRVECEHPRVLTLRDPVLIDLVQRLAAALAGEDAEPDEARRLLNEGLRAAGFAPVGEIEYLVNPDTARIAEAYDGAPPRIRRAVDALLLDGGDEDEAQAEDARPRRKSAAEIAFEMDREGAIAELKKRLDAISSGK